MTPLDSLTPEQEALVADAIEGMQALGDRARFEQLLASTPGLADEIERLTRAKASLATLADQDAQGIDLAPAVLEAWQNAPAPVVMRTMDAPPRALRFPVSARGVRAVAIAASLAVVAGLTVAFLRSGSAPRPAPGPSLAAANEPEAPSAIDPPAELPAESVAEAAVIERALDRARTGWAVVDAATPTIAEAVELLADRRLVVRCLAPGADAAEAATGAMAAGLETASPKWSLLGRAPALAARFHRPAGDPVYAHDEPTGRRIEVPQPRLDAVWTARLDQDASAIASLVHSLESLGLIVRLEASTEPIEPSPSLEDALWFDRPPSTWHPTGAVPIVVERLDR